MRLIALLCMAVLSVTVLTVIAGFLGKLHPLFDSVSHFRIHLAAVALVAAVPLLFTNWKVGVLAMMGAALAAATTIAALPVPVIGMKVGTLSPPDPDRPIYRLLQANLRYDNRTPEAFLSLVGRTGPDVITLNEVSEHWRPKLRVLEAAYPYSHVCDSARGIGAVAILSRRPFAGGGDLRCDRRGSLAHGDFDFGGRTIAIAALHLGWPWPFGQDRQVRQLQPRLAAIGETALLAGDMNATTWSRTVADVASAGGFEVMPSSGPTWITRRLPVAWVPLGLPIDHVFAKGDVQILGISRGEPIGSDHLPLIVDFSIVPPAGSPAGEPETDVAAAQRLRMSEPTSRSTFPPG